MLISCALAHPGSDTNELCVVILALREMSSFECKLLHSAAIKASCMPFKFGLAVSLLFSFDNLDPCAGSCCVL